MPRRQYKSRSQRRNLQIQLGTRVRLAAWEYSLDKWLKRLSYVSQAGLLLFAAGATYFVFMPMYMNAALDEAIARKANDIRRVSVSVDASYIRRRSVILRDFIRLASVECSTPTLAPLLVPVTSIQAALAPDKAVSVLPDQTTACLQKLVAAWSDIKEMRPGDREQLIKEIRLTGLALEEERHMAKVKFDAVPQIATVSPDALPRPSPLNQQSIDFNTKFSTAEQIAKQVLNARIEAERQRIEAAYSAKIMQHLTALENLAWLSSRVP